MAPKPTQAKDESDRTDIVGRMDRADPADPAIRGGQSGPENPCSAPTDRNAPAGAYNSLGAKSDCNGRPATDDSVVEAKDEMGPGLSPPADQPRDTRR